MTDVRVDGSSEPRLQSDGRGPRGRFRGDAPAADRPSSRGEARPALLTLVTPGGAPVCEGDSCFVPGAEGVWTEVPD